MKFNNKKIPRFKFKIQMCQYINSIIKNNKRKKRFKMMILLKYMKQLINKTMNQTLRSIEI